MASLPVISGREAVKVFESLGWTVARQSGSHIIMTKEGELVTLSIPNHKEVAKGTLRSLIRAANLTVDEFVAAI
jgi:predicted RNA binding protein YcfA (HicA-like mRNA interferase family)